MRKYHHTSCGGLILAAILTAGAACADVWPSWLSPASGSYDRGNQALSGAVERLTVVAGPWAYTNYMTTNLYASYFSQWAKCDTAKRILSASLSDGKWVYPAGSYDPDTLSVVTKANLITTFGLPTNYWDVTPRFNLAVETNGWVLIPGIMSNVVWTKTAHAVDGGYTNAFWAGYLETNTWAAATNGAEGSWALDISDYSGLLDPNEPCRFSEGYNVGGTDYAAWLINNTVLYSSQFLSTNYAHSADLWAKATSKSLYSLNETFDSQGVSGVSTNWSVIKRTNETWASSWDYSVGEGGFTNASIPSWVSEPSEDSDLALGFVVSYSETPYYYMVTKWNGTNGFKWFR